MTVPSPSPLLGDSALGNTSPFENRNAGTDQNHEPEAEAVIKFLRKRGLGSAVLELERHLQDENNSKKSKVGIDGDVEMKDGEEKDQDAENLREMKRIEAQNTDKDTPLTYTTGGGVGYDLDAAPAVLTWANGAIQDQDDSNVKIKKDNRGTLQEQLKDKMAETTEKARKQTEAKRYTNSFTKLQTWVLSLPDEDLSVAGQFSKETSDESKKTGESDLDVLMNKAKANLDIAREEKESSTPQEYHSKAQNAEYFSANFIPAFIKPELLSVTFTLFVHTYCDLLENDLEHSASTLLQTYRHVYEPRYPTEFRDLDRCCTTVGIKKLNQIVVAANEALAKAKSIRNKYDKHRLGISKTAEPNAQTMGTISNLEKEYNEIVETHALLLRKLKDYPFLKRVRSIKWLLNISSITFGYLFNFLRDRETLLPMSIVLQNRCHVVVEKRDPSPFIPACILEDMILPGSIDGSGDTTSSKKGQAQFLPDVRWAAAVDPSVRSKELGELENTILKDGLGLPFPKYFLEKEYETQKDYADDKKNVDFNRALLTHGFRRLAALEVKEDFDNGNRVVDSKRKEEPKDGFGDPLAPSIMMSTLCSSFEATKIEDPKSLFEESGIELTCAKMCPPDGRRVAVGCDDSAVRIFSMEYWTSLNGTGSVDDGLGASNNESVTVLLGHKRGLPIFDLDWNKDGRTLLSAGGDGTIRIWDTKAIGTVGNLGTLKGKQKVHSSGAKTTTITSTTANTSVPGEKTVEGTPKENGSCLVCYQGHAPSTPVWSVSIAPCGYYFVSTGADSTARLWCTDRPTPIRVFTGHYNDNVNCTSWHPNCNYIVTGGDDKTVRMWDVQSGNCVRLLSGCAAGVNKVKVSPSGQMIAGADYNGVVHIWDIRNGRKLNEFRHTSKMFKNNFQIPIVESLSFSPCGTALATGSDDCTVRIWDAQGLGNHAANPEFVSVNGRYNSVAQGTVTEPAKSFRTNKTSILDLQYTKRNLLLSVGKYFSS